MERTENDLRCDLNLEEVTLSLKEYVDTINSFELGIYKETLIRKAEKYAFDTIQDYEEHTDAIYACVFDYLSGAEEVLRMMASKKILIKS